MSDDSTTTTPDPAIVRAAARATGLTTEPSESEDGRSMRRFA